MLRSPERLPDPPASLPGARAAELTACTQAALERQRRELAQSVDRAFEHVPAPLRGAVRRILRA